MAEGAVVVETVVGTAVEPVVAGQQERPAAETAGLDSGNLLDQDNRRAAGPGP